MSKPSHESGPFQAEDDAASKYPAQTAEDASARANNSAAYRAQLEAQPHVILESIEADHTDAREEKQTTPDSSAMYSSDDAMEYDSDDEEEEEETIEAVGVGPVIVNGRPIHGGLRPLPSQQSQESALIAAVIGNLSPNLDIGSSPSAFDSEFDDLSGSDIDAADDTIQAERGPADRRSHQDISPAASPTRPTRSPSEFGEGPLISPIDQEFHEVICPTILVRQPEYVQDGSSPSVSPTTMPQALAVDTGSRYPAPIVELGDPYVEERFRPQPCPDMGYDLDLLNEGEVIEVASQSAYVGPLMLQESVRESVHPSIEHDRLDTDMTDPGVSQPIADDTHDTASARAFPKSWPSSKARIEGILSRAPIGALVDTALAWSYAGARLTEPAKSIKHIASRADWEETTGDSVPYWQLELLYEHRKAQLSSMDSSEWPDLKLEQLSRQEAAGGAAGFAAKARGIRVPLRSAATSGGAAVDSDPDCVSRLTKEEWLESLGIGDGVRTRQTRGKRQASRPDRRSDTAGSDSVHSRAAARPSRMSRKDAVETAKNSSNGITAIKRAAGMKTSSARLHGADARSLYPELPTSLQGYWSRGPASTDTCEAHTSIPMYCPPSCNGDRQTVLRLLSTVGQRGAPRTAFNGVWRAESFDPQLTKLASLWGSSIPELRDEITQMWQGWKNIRKHPDLVQQGLSGNPSAIVHYLLTPRDVQGSSGQASVATSIAVKDDRVVGDEILVMGSGD